MPFLELCLQIPERLQEIFVALFQEFDSFRMEEDELYCYLPESSYNQKIADRIAQFMQKEGLPETIKQSVIEEKNWNEEWEKTITPILAGGFSVQASWSALPSNGDEVIVIDPKMSFGTGHHETTRLMLRMMESVDFSGLRVLDAGTGTGVLAIAAVIRKCYHALAFDTDPLSTKNAIENRDVNKLDPTQIEFHTGNFDKVAEGKEFDIILANINKNALLNLLEKFRAGLVDGGGWLVSGLLEVDFDEFVAKASESGFRLIESCKENEWIGLRFTKD